MPPFLKNRDFRNHSALSSKDLFISLGQFPEALIQGVSLTEKKNSHFVKIQWLAVLKRQELLMLSIHLRHTNICVLCYGRKPSASTCPSFRAATQEGLYIYSTSTVSQQTRLSVTFKINIPSPSSSL